MELLDLLYKIILVCEKAVPEIVERIERIVSVDGSIFGEHQLQRTTAQEWGTNVSLWNVGE
jgi:hypothetical protein